jgi:hypothetical protein
MLIASGSGSDERFSAGVSTAASRGVFFEFRRPGGRCNAQPEDKSRNLIIPSTGGIHATIGVICYASHVVRQNLRRRQPSETPAPEIHLSVRRDTGRRHAWSQPPRWWLSMDLNQLMEQSILHGTDGTGRIRSVNRASSCNWRSIRNHWV